MFVRVQSLPREQRQGEDDDGEKPRDQPVDESAKARVDRYLAPEGGSFIRIVVAVYR
jgi:hypothetical protein